MNNKQSYLVIRQRHPVLMLLFVLVILLAIAMGGWTLFDYGRHRAGYDSLQADEVRKTNERRLDELQEQVSVLRGELARLKTGKEVDTFANEEVKKTLASLQQVNQELREELQFYRSIVSPDRGRPGVHIHNFNLTQGENSGEYYYNITLIHIQGLDKHHRQVKGELKLVVEGEQEGVTRRFDLAELASTKNGTIRFVFKYFKRFEGRLVLPRGFLPRTVQVEAVSGTSKIKGDIKQIEWPNQSANQEGNLNVGES